MHRVACCVQCIARDVDGKREVAGVHWDYDCYGAPGKMAQVCALTLMRYLCGRQFHHAQDYTTIVME